ncbi:MAG: SPOR domain-containing protein [Gammaproteobacteria bacterium]|nr:SPOR domain-containing protein [Gammaproteobacteria bacterium]
MDQNLKERLVGAAVLIILAVIFIPMFLSDAPITDDRITETNIPEKPEVFSSRIVPLDPDQETGVGQEQKDGAAEPQQEITEEQARPGQPADTTPPDTATNETEPEIRVKDAATNGSGVGLTAWVVQLGSFSQEENAQSLNRQLREHKYPSFVEPLIRGNNVIYRVRVGPELRRSNAENLRDEIKDKLGVDGILVRYP